jgi:tetratricopeptide (TPR) repeat protein
LTLITYLNWYYVLRGLSHVAEARMREALANAEPASNEVYCHALHCMGDFLIYQGRFVEAEPWYRKSLRMATQIDSKLMLGVSQVELAWSLAEQGKFDDAEETIQRAIEVQTQHQGPNWIGSAYCIACLIANRRGDPETALERGAVSIRWCREGGYKWGLASVLNEMAFASRAVGDLNAALTYETESIEIKRGILSPRSLALSLESLARIYLDLGAIPEAKQSAQEAFRILRSLGDTTTLPSMHEVASRVCAKLGQAKLSEAFRVAMTPTPDLCPVGRQSDYSPPFDAAPNGRTVAPIVDAFLAL